MSDLIERQDAVDAVLNLSEKVADEMLFIDAIVDEIENIPSAKPESSRITILHRKIDLHSILQAIKSDKIRVWMNFDGEICFRNTKTGNEISVYPYYDMNGEKFDE